MVAKKKCTSLVALAFVVVAVLPVTLLLLTDSNDIWYVFIFKVVSDFGYLHLTLSYLLKDIKKKKKSHFVLGDS